ncbi:hypothetical protein [Mucilaginibacter paludis]|uniref:Uncharacterized protein n=1 Tax=Mucilaginibacter paludis DSM 18603 TaxID=714943 RepID=H1YDT2_9SPHI|nr:hypothetical protein [Mucilaginibacter paludis]EHQ24272.1 hypothetical protein Mucpa_0069 [Mucilaginibacter paludis DSM 18603]
MERIEFIAQFKSFLIMNDPAIEIERLFIKAIGSGAVNISREPPGSYRLCMIVYAAILHHIASDWEPSGNENQQELRNLQSFLQQQ